MKRQNLFGFYSVSGFTYSLFGMKSPVINAIPAIIMAITGFITGFIYESSAAVFVLWSLMTFDWITGIWKSTRAKQFVSYKIFRMPIYFLATSIILSLSWNMAKNHWMFIPLPGLVLGGFYSTYFISLLENLGELGFLPKSIVTLLKNKFGLKTIIDKFDTKEGESK